MSKNCNCDECSDKKSRLLTEGSIRKYQGHSYPESVVNNPPPAPSAHGFWYSCASLGHLNDGGILVAGGVEYCLGGRELFCRDSQDKPFEACGDMKADDFIKALIMGVKK